MKTQLFLGGDSLWPTLKKLARTASGRRLVAVPYVAEGASALLPLRKGDALVCALSLANAKSGVVCPQELRKLTKKKVLIFQRPDLHAKVFLLGTTAVVSSTNLSRHSVDVLDEAALVTRDPRTVAAVARWFETRLTEPVGEEWLAKCEKAYRKPRGGAGPRKGKKTPRTNSGGRRVWMVGLQAAEFPESEEPVRFAAFQEAKRFMQHPRSNDIHEIRMTGHRRFRDQARLGDTCIQVFDEEPGKWVQAAGRVVAVKHVERGGRRIATYISLELPARYRSKRWKEFRKQCRRRGVSLGAGGVECRELRSTASQDIVLGLVPRSRRP